MYFGDIDIPNGNPLKFNGSQVDKIMLGDSQVWINNIPPSAITDFVAGGGLVNEINVTFTSATGIPTPTHNLINADSGDTLATNISSGYKLHWTTWGVNLRVDAINDAGTTPSNVDWGESKSPAGSTDLTGNGTFAVPYGIYSISICMAGAGGGGETLGIEYITHGGEAGEVKSSTLSVSPGDRISYDCGTGGEGFYESYPGEGGGSTEFGSLSAAGGSGGYGGSGPMYNGEEVTTCGGTHHNGLKDTDGESGEYGGGESSGFSDGGHGAFRGAAGNGGYGSGGGATEEGDGRKAGNGGDGIIRVSWD